MQQKYAFKDISIWVNKPEDLQPPLSGDATADVVIVGGGLTGLSTALELKERGVDVAIIEKNFCGSGASGRNAGHLTPTIGKDIPTILTMFGRERAQRLLHFADGSIEHATGIMEKYNIDCDYVAGGNIIAAVHAKQEAGLEKAAKIAGDLGAHVAYLDTDHMRQKAIPKTFTAGIWEQLGGVLHPGKYVMALRDAALKAGVKIYENSPMLRVNEGAQPVVHCAQGRLTAAHLVQATNAYTNASGRMKRAVLPLRVTLFETEKLTDEQRSRLGWPGMEGIYSAHEMLENFRLTKYGTLQGGSKIVRSTFGGGLAEGYHEPTFNAMTQMFRDRFPELPDVNIATWWGGWIGLTTNFLPKMGTHKKHANIHHAIGYNGHGVAQATHSGQMMADRITGRDNQFNALFEELGFLWPPEPLTWLGSKALTAYMGNIDARVDKAVRRAAHSA